MTGFGPMPGTYYTVCFALVILAWVFFSLAFTVFRPKTPGASAAAATRAGGGAAPDAPATADQPKPARDRRSLWGVLLQGLGYAIMWTAPRPPFPRRRVVLQH